MTDLEPCTSDRSARKRPVRRWGSGCYSRRLRPRRPEARAHPRVPGARAAPRRCSRASGASGPITEGRDRGHSHTWLPRPVGTGSACVVAGRNGAWFTASIRGRTASWRRGSRHGGDLAFGGGSVWAMNCGQGGCQLIYRLHPGTGVAGRQRGVSPAMGWAVLVVVDDEAGAVVIDPRTGREGAQLPLGVDGDRPFYLTGAGEDSVVVIEVGASLNSPESTVIGRRPPPWARDLGAQLERPSAARRHGADGRIANPAASTAWTSRPTARVAWRSVRSRSASTGTSKASLPRWPGVDAGG